MKKKVGPRKLHRWCTKVVGVTFRNEDGSDRQRILGRCRGGMRLRLALDPGNPRDGNAVRVLRDGGQLGHVSSELAEDVAPLLRDGFRGTGFVLAVTGGTREKPTRGVNILIIAAAPEVSPEEMEAYELESLEREGLMGEFRGDGVGLPSASRRAGEAAGWAARSAGRAAVAAGLGLARGSGIAGRGAARSFAGWPEWARWVAYGLAVGVPVIVVMVLVRNGMR